MEVIFMDYSKLIIEAIKAKENAYAVYSNFKVGAAVLTLDGEIYTGSNIENASYGGTICAERVAFCKAVFEGKRDFKAIAIFGNGKPCPPCGICRQFMSEFCKDDFEVISGKQQKSIKSLLLEIYFPIGRNG